MLHCCISNSVSKITEIFAKSSVGIKIAFAGYIFSAYRGKICSLINGDFKKPKKSRLATEAKAEFTDVNEHFAEGA